MSNTKSELGTKCYVDGCDHEAESFEEVEEHIVETADWDDWNNHTATAAFLPQEVHDRVE